MNACRRRSYPRTTTFCPFQVILIIGVIFCCLFPCSSGSAVEALLKRRYIATSSKIMRSHESNQTFETGAKNGPATTNETSSATVSVPVRMMKAATAKLPQRGRERDPIYLWSSLVAGAGSGALASVICAPLDLIRTRLQVWTAVKGSKGEAASTLPRMLNDIIKSEGWRGCFRGLGATLVTVPLFWGIYFPLYDDFKRNWSNKQRETNPALIHMGSAVLAGAVSDIVCNPMFVVRTRLQTEALHNMLGNGASGVASERSKYSGILKTALSLYKEGGPFIFWRGMTANLMGLSHVAVQFPVYEQLKKTLRRHKRHESALDLLLASGLSKMSASVLTYPHEVIRSRMMDARTGAGFTQSCRRIYAAEGLLGFYAGLPISLIRVVPNTCITFLSYELLLRCAKERIQEHRLMVSTER